MLQKESLSETKLDRFEFPCSNPLTKRKIILNPYLNYHIAQVRHSEFLRQAEKNRQFERQMRYRTRPVVQRLSILLPTFPKSGLQIVWLGTIVERVGYGLANFGARLKSAEPN